jgi:lysophospholipase L1-like esterase
VNKNGLIAREAFYELANKYNGAVWDLFDIMGGLSSMKQWESVGLAQHDKIHFTAIGYNLIGDLFYNALISEYLKYLSENSKIL